MWARQVILAVIGLSSGIAVAGGLFSFIIGLGVVSDFADRTHTGANVILYEEMIALGGILGNIMYVYQICIPGVQFLIGPVSVQSDQLLCLPEPFTPLYGFSCRSTLK